MRFHPMIRTFFLLLLPLTVAADIPRKPSPTRYTTLWNPSPFTTKPVIEGEVREEESPLDDYALGGVSKVEEGYFVVLLNKKDPQQREVIEPGGASEFKVEEVKWDISGGKDTVVRIRHHDDVKDIGFDRELLTKKQQATTARNQAAEKAQQLKPPVLPRTVPTPPGGQGRPSGRAPRVVRPPTPRTNNTNQGRR